MKPWKHLIVGWSFEFFGYGSIAVSSYLPLYFEHVGYSRFEIGLLMATSPLSIITSTPFLGRLADLIPSRSNLILFMNIIAATLPWVLYADYGFIPTFLVAFGMFSLTMSSIPIGESIMLRHSTIGERHFNKIRIMGTVGFALVSLITGYSVAHGFVFLFLLLSSIIAAVAFAGWRLPAVETEERTPGNSSIRVMLENPILRPLFVLGFLQTITLGFHYSFFPLYADHIFHSERILGYLILVQTLAEIPVLLMFPLLQRRYSIRTLGIAIAVGFSVRWLLTSFYFRGAAAFFIQLLHGFGVVPLTLLTMMEINRTVPAQTISGSQSMYWSIQTSGQIIGSVIGGIVAQMISLQMGYILSTLVSTGALIAYIALTCEKPRGRAVV